MTSLDKTLTKAWMLLMVLSLGSAALTLLGLPVKLTGAAILLLALTKARVILSQYLGLNQVPGIRRGVMIALTLFILTIFALSMV